MLCIEELNVLFEHHKTAQSFFALLRSWQEEARHDPVWQQLRQVVSYSVELPKNPQSIESLKALVTSDRPVMLDPFLAYQLEAKGLIKMTSDGWIIRLNLYRYCLQNWLV